MADRASVRTIVSCCAVMLIGAALAACLGSSGSTRPTASSIAMPGAASREQAINTHFTGRQLAPVEGIWTWDDNQYEVAIYRNPGSRYKDYQYLGVVLSSGNKDWKPGEVKLLLKESASDAVFPGIYVMGDKDQYGTTFVMPHRHLIETTLPGYYGRMYRMFFIRTYPKSAEATASAGAGGKGSGSGFFVWSDIVVTNAHVVANAKKVTVVAGQNRLDADVLSSDRANDLAVLKTRLAAPGGQPCLSLTQGDLRAGDRIFVLGHPLTGMLGQAARISEGIVSSPVGIQNDPRMYQISAPIQPGNSGSPLIDERGMVVGVVTSSVNVRAAYAASGTIPQNVNFAIKSSYLRNLLASQGVPACPTAPAPVSLNARQIGDGYGVAIVQIEVAL